MKTSGMEVLCDGCGKPMVTLNQPVVYATFRGPYVGHKKGDFCNWQCLAKWAEKTSQQETVNNG